MILISEEMNRYKANLHCHSNISDGRLTPEELKEAYRKEGYSVLAITDHECPYDHSALSDPSFLMLTGYEAYIRPDPKYDLYQPEVHLNFFARDPKNVNLICFDAPFVKYRKTYDSWKCPRAGSEAPRQYTPEYIAEFIKTAKANGYIVSYNHPEWSLENEEYIFAACRECFSLEMFNSSSYLSNGIEYCAGLYDRLLRSGMNLFCHAADDNHNVAPLDSPDNDSFLGCTVILAPDLSYDSVFRALETGSFYSSRGPQIRRLTVEGHHVTIDCDPVTHIHAYCGNKDPNFLRAKRGETITHAEFDIHPRAMYLRLSIFDAEGNSADTRAYFPEELGW